MDSAGEDALHQVNLNLDPNEASGLVRIQDGELLKAHGWEFGFWAVMDEEDVADCVAAMGHHEGAAEDEGWEILRLHNERLGSDKKAEDAESVTRWGKWVYVLGSQHGGKRGPVKAKEAWVARFHESWVKHTTGGSAAPMEVVRTDLLIHRLVNDALEEKGPGMLEQGPNIYEAFTEATVEEGREKDKRWAHNVKEGDVTINVEGAAFRDDGSLLLGLCYPVEATGKPVLAELTGIDRLFEGGRPEVRGFYVIDAVGREGSIAGVRDLAIDNNELHLVTGNIDSRDKGSVLLDDHPGGSDTVATHFHCTLPKEPTDEPMPAEVVREFPSLPRVEGIAFLEDGRFFYVTDEDEGVHLRLTRLLEASGS